MMIAVLDRFDRITAAGILARAALAVEDEGNPAGSVRLPDEGIVRQAVLAEVRKLLRILPDDQSAKTLERLGDVLDTERDALIGPTDSESTLKRLAEKGELPSDLYDVRVIRNIEEFHGKKFRREKNLIETTVRSPDHEQHYGPPSSPNDPFLISLFAKYFPDQYSLRSFTLLVAGQRKGLVLDVHQAWRVYADVVNLEGVTDLVSMLHRFSDAFGAEIQLGDQKGHFILSANIPKGRPIETTFELKVEAVKTGKKPEIKTITVTSFFQQNPLGETNQAVLVTGIDLSHYREVLKARGW